MLMGKPGSFGTTKGFFLGLKETRGLRLMAMNALATGSYFTELRPFYFIKVASIVPQTHRTPVSGKLQDLNYVALHC